MITFDFQRIRSSFIFSVVFAKSSYAQKKRNKREDSKTCTLKNRMNERDAEARLLDLLLTLKKRDSK